MGCSICLDTYTQENRPAALPCGHIFHHACILDWLSTRNHSALPSGCPLCKAPATTSSVLPLWPTDDLDFGQYVASHSADPSACNGAHGGLLASVRDWVFSMQAYAMAAYGLQSSAMSKASHRIGTCHRGLVQHALAEQHMHNAMQALTQAVVHAERLSRELAQRTSSLDENNRQVHLRQVQLRNEQQHLDTLRQKLEHERTSLKHKLKHAAQTKRELAEQHDALERRGQSMEKEQQAQAMRTQEAIACAKSQSAEAIRKAALAEEAAMQRASEAEDRARAAEEHASDMADALHATRAKNQSMADQMRALQAALASNKSKRRSERETSDHLRSRVLQLEHERDASASPLRERSINECMSLSRSRQGHHVPETPDAGGKRKRATGVDAGANTDAGVAASFETEPDPHLSASSEFAPTLISLKPKAESSAPTPSPSQAFLSSLTYDMDDNEFPMPGGSWPTMNQPHSRISPHKHTAVSDSLWIHSSTQGAVALGPRRRPT